MHTTNTNTKQVIKAIVEPAMAVRIAEKEKRGVFVRKGGREGGYEAQLAAGEVVGDWEGECVDWVGVEVGLLVVPVGA